MTGQIDLKTLSMRESEQVEWKENVADTEDVVATLSAFANDWSNLGGGYVVCGAKEDKDELTTSRLKEVEGKVLAACRTRVSPPIAPVVHEIRADDPDHRILVFVMAATRSPHSFRRRGQAPQYYVRIGRQTIEARNGIWRELLVRKGEIEDWDRRPCPTAAINDLDLLALRDALHQMDVFNAELGIDEIPIRHQAVEPLRPSSLLS